MEDGASIGGDYLGFRSYGGEVELHCHNFHQLVLPHRGVLELEVGGRGGAVAPGRGVLIAAGTRHAFRATGANGFVVVDAAAPALDAAALERFEAAAFFAIRPPVQALLDYLAATLRNGEAAPAMRDAWCALLFDALAGDRIADGAPGCLERAIAFMRARLDRPISVADIARAAGIGETGLNALFRERHATSPHAFLIELRVDAALRLLTTTDLPVAEIALRTGHADQSGLTRRLRLSRGITPAAARRKNPARTA